MFSCILNIRTFLCISLHAQGIFWFPRMKKGMDRKSPSFIKFHHTSTNLRFFAGLAGFEHGKWWESKGFNKLSVLFKAEKASRKNTPHLPRPTIPSSLKAWKIPGKKKGLFQCKWMPRCLKKSGIWNKGWGVFISTKASWFTEYPAVGDKHIKVLEDQLEISSPTKRKFICTCFSSTVPFYVAYKASIMAQLLAPVLPSAASGPLCSGDGRENCLAPTLSHCSILWHPMLLLRVQDLPFHGVSFARFFKVVKISFHVHQLLLRSQRGSPAVLPSSPKKAFGLLGTLPQAAWAIPKQHSNIGMLLFPILLSVGNCSVGQSPFSTCVALSTFNVKFLHFHVKLLHWHSEHQSARATVRTLEALGLSLQNFPTGAHLHDWLWLPGLAPAHPTYRPHIELRYLLIHPRSEAKLISLGQRRGCTSQCNQKTSPNPAAKGHERVHAFILSFHHLRKTALCAWSGGPLSFDKMRFTFSSTNMRRFFVAM